MGRGLAVRASYELVVVSVGNVVTMVAVCSIDGPLSVIA